MASARGQLDQEVAARRGVHAVGHGPLEPELFGDLVAIDVEGGAGDGARAERQLVHAARGVVEPPAIAPQHLEPGQQVVREAHRLRALQMRVARHQRGDVLVGAIDQDAAQSIDRRRRSRRRAPRPQAQIGGDLVVARSPGVQLAAQRADELDEPRLDVHVHVFERRVPLHLALAHFAAHLLEPVRASARARRR